MISKVFPGSKSMSLRNINQDLPRIKDTASIHLGPNLMLSQVADNNLINEFVINGPSQLFFPLDDRKETILPFLKSQPLETLSQ